MWNDWHLQEQTNLRNSESKVLADKGLFFVAKRIFKDYRFFKSMTDKWKLSRFADLQKERTIEWIICFADFFWLHSPFQSNAPYSFVNVLLCSITSWIVSVSLRDCQSHVHLHFRLKHVFHKWDFSYPFGQTLFLFWSLAISLKQASP